MDLTALSRMPSLLPVAAWWSSPCKADGKVVKQVMVLSGEGRRAGFWLPFGYGPHMCIGYGFALQKMKVSNICIGRAAREHASPPRLEPTSVHCKRPRCNL